VDPATEVRLQRALDGLAQGRTSVTVAHRLSTAEAADLVAVMDAGRLVDVGSHRDLLGRCEVYQRLYRAWASALQPIGQGGTRAAHFPRNNKS
jgi:putative ABC transport system ATP-binding protein